MPRCLPMLTSFFDRFLMGFCSQLRPLEPQESSPRCSESTIYQKFAFRNLYWFFIDFGATKLPFSFQNPPKSLRKSILEGIRFLIDFSIDFLMDFCWIWGGNLAPCWPLFPSKCGSAVARSPLFCWVYVLLPFFGQPGPLLAPFGLDFGGSGLDFQGFWLPFSSHFLFFWTAFFQQP